MTVLVLGATGTTGRRVLRRLRDRGVMARGAARHGEVVFDWGRQETWGPALADVSAIYLMAPHDVPIDEAFVTQAVAAGVERLVLLSSRGIEAMGDERLLAAERLVRNSGTAWTIVRPDWFYQNFDEGFFRPAVLAGEVVVPLGDMRQAFVDAEDIAAVAVEALTADGHHGQTYEVTGPDALTFTEAVASIADATGRKIDYRGAPDDYRTTMAAFGAPPEQTEAEITAFTALTQTGDSTVTTTVTDLTGRPPIPFPQYAAAAAATPAWRD